MKLFLLNILLAILWVFLWGSFHGSTFVAGFIIAYILLGLVGRVYPETGDYGKRVYKLFRFAIYFIRILIIANLEVAKLIITPGMNFKSRIVRYYVGDLNPIQITTLANAITLTPGTLSMDISGDDQYLYVHCMNAEDREAAIKDLDEFKNRLMAEVFE